MEINEIVKALQPWVAKHRRPAWKPTVVEGDDLATASTSCGIPWIGPDAPWPDCGHCKQPLSPFLQLDLDDLPEELGGRFGTGLLQLFYCIRDECTGFGGWEPFADDLSRVRIVHPTGPSESMPASPQPILLPAKRIVAEDQPSRWAGRDRIGVSELVNESDSRFRIPDSRILSL